MDDVDKLIGYRFDPCSRLAAERDGKSRMVCVRGLELLNNKTSVK